MQENTDKCQHLRRLHAQIVEELQMLKGTLREKELESFDNPIEMVNVIKSLQETLNTVTVELAKCPDEG